MIASALLWIALPACGGDKDKGVDQGNVGEDTSPPGDTAPGDTGEDCEIITLYYDGDGDGHGDPEVLSAGCDGLEGWSATGDDCDDADSTVWEDCVEHACYELGTLEYREGGDTGLDTGGDTGATVTSSTYWLCEENMGWQDARQYCYDYLAADLVTLEQPGEIAGVQALSAKLDEVRPFWIGVYQPDTSPSAEFGWTWISARGTVDDRELSEGGIWHVGQPDNGGHTENEGGSEEEDVGAWINNAGTWGVMDVRIDQETWPICELNF